MNAIELMEFNRTHLEAVKFMTAATDDYVACRCCLLNGLFPGLRLGAEAVEKYLKAFVLFANRSLDVKKYNHRIKDLASEASHLTPGFNPVQFAQVIDRLETHYRNRYPNVPAFKRDASTGELTGIDEFVLHICDSFPIPEVPKFRDYGYFFFVFCPWTSPMQPYRTWLERHNPALERARNSLLQRYQATEQELGD
jgi:HEPN domain-containing protein